MISDDQIELLLRAALVIQRKGYAELAKKVVQVTIIEKVDEYVLDDFDESSP